MLAERLAHQADLCPDSHDPPAPAKCPFCADTVAFQTYLDAAGLQRPKAASGETINVADLRRSSSA